MEDGQLRLDAGDDLEALGGSGGYLAEEAPEPWCREGVDAVVLSLDNKLE